MKLKYRSKEKEQKFLEHLEGLFENAADTIPDCLHKGMFCPFVQYEKKVEQLIQSGRFDRYSGSADQFLSGLAETFKVKESKSAPVLGVINTPYGTVEYAKRGNTDPLVLAGIQNYEHETWRMLAFSTLVKTKGVRVFSSKTKYIGSCKGEVPDISFFSEILDEHSVAHSTNDIIDIGSSDLYFDLILFGQITVRIHEDCKQNVLPLLMKHILSQDPYKDVQVKCPVMEEVSSEIPVETLNAYFLGKKENRTFIRNILDFRKKAAVARGVYILGNDSYNDPEKFLSSFEETSYDPGKLLAILNERSEGVMLENASFRKLLELLWHDHREQIVETYYPEFDNTGTKSLTGDPLQVLNSIGASLNQKIMEKSITVDPWSPDSEYLISLIKTHIMKGKDDAVRSGEKGATNKTRKSVFYAYLMAVEGARNREWMFTNEEKELGQKLLPPMTVIIREETDDLNAEIEKLRVYVI